MRSARDNSGRSRGSSIPAGCRRGSAAEAPTKSAFRHAVPAGTSRSWRRERVVDRRPGGSPWSSAPRRRGHSRQPLPRAHRSTRAPRGSAVSAVSARERRPGQLAMTTRHAGHPVDSTPLERAPEMYSCLAVPPVEMSSHPSRTSPCANSVKPVLSETESRARGIQKSAKNCRSLRAAIISTTRG